MVALPGSNINTRTDILFASSQQNMGGFPSNIQGIVGMGYSSNQNFLDCAYNQNQISSSAFALDINGPDQPSLLYYNDFPEILLRSTVMMPLQGNSYWELEVIGFYAGGQEFTKEAAKGAVLDSGTSYFYLNSELYGAVTSAFFSACAFPSEGSPVCSCEGASSWPTFALMFPGA